MSRCQKTPLRPLSEDERQKLQRLARASIEPAEQVAWAKALLAVADGCNYTEAARRAGRQSGDAVSQRVERFNSEGLGALVRRSGQGSKPTYGPAERTRVLAEVQRQPEPAEDGTASWSLMTLRRALREAPDGLPQVSTYTIRSVLEDAGYRWLGSRSWCQTGEVVRRRKSGPVTVIDPDAVAKKT
jgi:hypothetical protein